MTCFAPWCGIDGKYANPGVCNAPGGHAYKAPASRTEEAPSDPSPRAQREGYQARPGNTAGPASPNAYSPLHPHEPDVPPTLDSEGRCLVCQALVRAEGEGFSAGYTHASSAPLWLLMGDLDTLENMIADYIQQRGQHLPGVSAETISGTPVATANMAMSVIRKNIRRFGMQR